MQAMVTKFVPSKQPLGPKGFTAGPTPRLVANTSSGSAQEHCGDLTCRKPGANPLTHLSLVEYPLADPGFFALRSSFLDLVRFGSRQDFCFVAQELLQSPVPLETGLVAVLIARCHEVGISWHMQSSSFVDRFGPLCLFTTAPQELDLRESMAERSCFASCKEE